MKRRRAAGRKRVAVFLDRDGTVVRDVGYLRRLKHLDLYRRSARAVRLLNDRGLAVALVTNQSGVARGYYSLTFLREAHGKLRRLLEAEGARLDAVYLCPHHPEDRCRCRKPEPGLLLDARRDLGVDLKRSFVVGDKRTDVQLARRVGARAVLVRTGAGGEALAEIARRGPLPNFVARDLYSAARWILGVLDGTGPPS